MFSTQTRPAWLTRKEQLLYQIDQQALGSQPVEMVSNATKGARVVMVHEVWCEQALGANWIAAFRLHYHDDGRRLVVGELRVFPAAGQT